MSRKPISMTEDIVEFSIDGKREYVLLPSLKFVKRVMSDIQIINEHGNDKYLMEIPKKHKVMVKAKLRVNQITVDIDDGFIAMDGIGGGFGGKFANILLKNCKLSPYRIDEVICEVEIDGAQVFVDRNSGDILVGTLDENWTIEF